MSVPVCEYLCLRLSVLMDRGSTHISRHDREVDRKGGKGGVTTGFMVQDSGFRVQGSGWDRHPKP